MNIAAEKLKEVLTSVLPVAALVMVLHFTISPLKTDVLIRFILGTALIILGLVIFLLGVDIGITPLGALTGGALAKSNKLWVVLTAGLILGFFISIAEPGLMVLAGQVNEVTAGAISKIGILIAVSIGLALMLSGGFLRIFYNIPLYKLLFFLYTLILIICLFASREFIAIGFDASGATTGILAVPFILALSVGTSRIKQDSKASEKDSFGLVAIASTGAIMAVLILDLVSETKEFAAALAPEETGARSLFGPFMDALPAYFTEAVLAIAPLVVILLVLQKFSFKLVKKEIRKVGTGFVYAFVGLLVFLVGVSAGFMEVGTTIGTNLASMDNKTYILVFSFVLGFLTILAEPAVYVLTNQIEEVTSGYIKRRAVLIPLAIGVGLAVALSIVRILVPGVQLWHYILPGYIICLAMSLFIPKLFVGIAFDAGGVATGPMTATFILAFTQGAANSFEGADLMADGFGMIAMVAMMPIITLEILGAIFAVKSKRKGERKEHV